MRILGWIQSSFRVSNNRIQPVKERMVDAFALRKIQCQRDARHWKGQQARRWKIAAAFQNRQKRSAARIRNRSQQFSDARFGATLWNHALILLKTARAIQTVPLRSEERRVGKECRSRW